MSARPVVIGGGLAGITAALRLAEAGRRPVLIEARHRLGGRATSFDDVRTGLVLDNCQHVLMGCCTNLTALFRQLGVETCIDWSSQQCWRSPDGGIDVLDECPCPAPAHRLGGLLRTRMLSWREKVRLGRTMWRIMRMGRSGHESWRGRTFSAFLDACRETQRVRERFWTPIVASACNLHLHEVAATHALHVFQDAFLSSRRASRVGVPSVPLSALYAPARALLETSGGTLRMGEPVQRIEVEDRRVRSVQLQNESIECETVICAAPFNRVGALVNAPDSRIQSLGALEHSPILGVHLLLDREVMRRPHLVLPCCGAQWVFNKGPLADGGGQHLHVVISAADEWMNLSEHDIRDRLLAELMAVFPALRAATVAQFRSVKSKQATFRATPGAEALRPQAEPGEGDVQGLHLAGDWCRTGWPATMEGAVISGHLAAQSVLGPGEAGPVAECMPDRLPRWLGVRR